MPPDQVAIEWFFPDRPELRCGLSLRAGGVSRGLFASLNLGGSTADRPEALAENRARFYRAAGLEPATAVRMHQVHGTRVVTATEPGDVGEADGLITAAFDLCLLATVADCLPVYLADPEAGVVGVLHAGWRGVAAGILQEGVAAAVRNGARPESLRAMIGPGIGPCCFEVGPDVAARFPPESLRPGRRERPHVDLPHAARAELLRAGIPAAAIAGGERCTRCGSERYFSARSGEPTGRMVAFIVRSDGGPARSAR
jgi:YfiH family protein